MGISSHCVIKNNATCGQYNTKKSHKNPTFNDLEKPIKKPTSNESAGN
jgi:hypothetical protein